MVTVWAGKPIVYDRFESYSPFYIINILKVGLFMRDFSEDTITLMFGDIEVLQFNLSNNIYNILNDKYMPYGLKNKVHELPTTTFGMTEDEINNKINMASYNMDNIRRWFAQRTLSLSRSNAKKLFNLVNFAQLEDTYNKYNIAVTCRGISVLDKYWVRFDEIDRDIGWDNVDIKRNHLNEIVAQVALHGDSLTFQGSFNTPEFTTKGIFPKAWRRHNDGNLWLHKLGINGSNHSRIEVMVSDILDKCNVDHVHYEAGIDDGQYVCMCPCISNDKYSVISAHEYNLYCNENNLNLIDEIMRIDHDGYYKMHIVDYLICNHDRHPHNWGFYMNNETMEVDSLHPLFDHNNAFDNKFLPNQRNVINPAYKDMKHKAEFAMTEVDFHFTKPIMEEDFIDVEYYEAFMKHADDLGVKTIMSNPFEVAVNKMG